MLRLNLACADTLTLTELIIETGSGLADITGKDL